MYVSSVIDIHFKEYLEVLRRKVAAKMVLNISRKQDFNKNEYLEYQNNKFKEKYVTSLSVTFNDVLICPTLRLIA